MGYLGDSNELYASIDMNIPLVKNVTSSPTFVKISGEHVVLKRPNNNTVPLALYVCVQEDNWVTRISLTNSVRNSILVDWWKNKKVKIDFDAGWLVGGTIKLSIVD
ncbi:MAG: hypothetical protein LBD17_05635, partial [Endomicrobium sp.]|jgi:hypothetical protein|nr:hypothetical protein [Endomicrobium sp.]